MTDAVLVGLYLYQLTGCLKCFHHRLSAFKAVEPRKLAGLRCHQTVVSDHFNTLKIMAHTDFKVIGVMRRRNLQRSGTKCHINIFVADDRDCPVHERQQHRAVFDTVVALILGIYGHGRIAQHGLGPGCGNNHTAFIFLKGVADMIQIAVVLFMVDLKIGQGRETAIAPVNDIIAAIDKALMIQLHENLAHRF